MLVEVVVIEMIEKCSCLLENLLEVGDWTYLLLVIETLVAYFLGSLDLSFDLLLSFRFLIGFGLPEFDRS